MMLTIENLKEKLSNEVIEDVLELLELSVAETVEYLTDEVETKQDKLRDYYDEDSESMGWEEESN